MVRATECQHNGRLIDVDEAIRLRSMAESNRHPRPLFLCRECGAAVKPVRASARIPDAHFEHFEGNPACSLSDYSDSSA